MTLQTLPDSDRLSAIRSSPRPFRLGLHDLWKRRRLLYVFVWRDLKARYKQTVLGAMWAVLQPLLTMAVFSFVFGRIAKLSSENLPYPVFVLCGLLPWQLVAQGVTRSGNSLVNERYLLTRAYIPRIIIPVSAVLSGLPDFGVSFLAAYGVMLYYGLTPKITVLLVLPFLLLALATAFCLGLFLSALNARYRDVSYLIPFAMQLWFFLTPVAYSSGLVPPEFRPLYFLNPMTGVVDGFRGAITGKMPGLNGAPLASSAMVCAALLLTLLYFQRMDRSFSDVV